MKKGLISIIVGVAIAVVVIIIVIVLLVVLLKGLDTSPVKEVTETIAVDVAAGSTITIADEYYYVKKFTEAGDEDIHDYKITDYDGVAYTYTYTDSTTRKHVMFSYDILVT